MRRFSGDVVSRTITTWAISTGENGFIGFYWFGHDALSWQDGFRLCTFRTRSVAREHLAVVRGPKNRGKFPKAKVVRVDVTMRPHETPPV